MEKKKSFRETKFSSRVIRRALDLCRDISAEKLEQISIYTVSIGDEEWRLDNLDECLGSYVGSEVKGAHIYASWDKGTLAFQLSFWPHATNIEIKGASRALIEKVFSIFEEASGEDSEVVPVV